MLMMRKILMANTGYSAFHLVTVNGGGSSEYTGKVEVEYLFLLVGELHVDVAHRGGDGVQHFFPLCPPIPENGSHSLYPLR